jgi:hypothetical protein
MNTSAVTQNDLDGFARKLTAKLAEWYHTERWVGPVPTIEVMVGAKFARLVEVTGTVNRLAYGFVDLANGDLLKADGWKQPAKGKRGNIFADQPLAGCTPYGMAHRSQQRSTVMTDNDDDDELPVLAGLMATVEFALAYDVPALMDAARGDDTEARRVPYLITAALNGFKDIAGGEVLSCLLCGHVFTLTGSPRVPMEETPQAFAVVYRAQTEVHAICQRCRDACPEVSDLERNVKHRLRESTA